MAFLPLKLSSFFSCKDTLSIFFHSYVFYHFTCTGCKACYIGETKRHLNTRIEQHLGKDKKSHIYSHLQENPQWQEKVNFDCFEIIDRAFSYFRLQIKEAMHINWKKPELNKQVKHVGITISIQVCWSIIVFFLLIFFYLFLIIPLRLLSFKILIIYFLIFNCFKSVIKIF